MITSEKNRINSSKICHLQWKPSTIQTSNNSCKKYKKPFHNDISQSSALHNISKHEMIAPKIFEMHRVRVGENMWFCRYLSSRLIQVSIKFDWNSISLDYYFLINGVQ